MPSRIRLRPRSTPAPPEADSETLFLDEADGVLKSIDDTGTVTTLGDGGVGGGAIAVDNGSDDPAEVTTIKMPADVVSEPGAAILLGFDSSDTTTTVSSPDPHDPPQPNDSGRISLESDGGDINVTASQGVADGAGGAIRFTAGTAEQGGGAEGAALNLFGGAQAADTGAPGYLDAWGHLILRSGALMIRRNTAPADADIANGAVALWFDKTNGAAKLKIKGKSTNGTVVVGEIPLT